MNKKLFSKLVESMTQMDVASILRWFAKFQTNGSLQLRRPSDTCRPLTADLIEPQVSATREMSGLSAAATLKNAIDS